MLNETEELGSKIVRLNCDRLLQCFFVLATIIGMGATETGARMIVRIVL